MNRMETHGDGGLHSGGPIDDHINEGFSWGTTHWGPKDHMNEGYRMGDLTGRWYKCIWRDSRGTTFWGPMRITYWRPNGRD